MEKNLHISYRINEQDEIVFVSEAWNHFAIDNNAPQIVSEYILYRSLWDFINDPTTVRLYRMILQQIRNGRAMKFNLRCNSPDSLRFLEMTVSLQENGDVQFDSRLIRAENRNPQKILQADIQRSDAVIIICSWCNRVNISDNDWQEVEEAVKVLGLFELEALPQISHGMCYDCYQKISRKL